MSVGTLGKGEPSPVDEEGRCCSRACDKLPSAAAAGAPSGADTAATEEEVGEEEEIPTLLPCKLTNSWSGAGSGRAAPRGQRPIPDRSHPRPRGRSGEEGAGREEAGAEGGSAHLRSFSFALLHLIAPGLTVGTSCPQKGQVWSKLHGELLHPVPRLPAPFACTHFLSAIQACTTFFLKTSSASSFFGRDRERVRDRREPSRLGEGRRCGRG